MSEPVFIIGIDLGTTNSVVAYTEAATERIEDAHIHIFAIPQVVDAGVVEKRQALPSFILAPQTLEVPEGALGLPWDKTAQLAVGEYARNRGEEIPQRLISSAKSWLCNTLVDRKAPILPWQGAGTGADGCEERKMSPVEAQSAILSHIRDAWNHTMAATDSDSGIDEDRKMENQLVYLTVPASFDAVARDLTIEAAEMAGLSHAVLLEEPQAAFYAWIGGGHGAWRDAVTAGDLILVCDVGGGTSDFSLIQVGEEEGDLTLERVAVGNHLLVGGDNMDLALAYSLARDLAQKGTKLNTRQMNGLWYSCRRAKEELLSNPDLVSRQVTILGRGTSLIGGMITTELTRDTVDSILRDGFFPVCKRSDKPKAAARAGIQEFGLAFESDAAITRHLAAFLDRPDNQIHPTGVLFNGGVMKAGLLRERIISILGDWTESGSIREIKAGDYDLAVARGAAYYGLARQGKGIRIRSGLERSYYIGVAAAMPAVPGMPAPTKALCVAPFGMEEGSSAQIKGQEFILIVGQPVVFDFFGSTTRREDAVGTVVEDWHEQLEAMTTLETTLAGEPGQVIPVTLELEVTEVGTLQLYCASKADDMRWKLEFNVREQ